MLAGTGEDNPRPTGTEAPAPARRLQSVPTNESSLTPEQRRIRDLENKLALEMGKKDPTQEYEVADANGDVIVVHFVADGFTALGHVWFRGQELEFTVGSSAYNDTCDRNGWSWLSLRDDPSTQESRYGEVKFRSGEWKGLSYQDGATKGRFERLAGVNPPTAVELSAADVAERKRKRAAPRLPLN